MIDLVIGKWIRFLFWLTNNIENIEIVEEKFAFNRHSDYVNFQLFYNVQPVSWFIHSIENVR